MVGHRIEALAAVGAGHRRLVRVVVLPLERLQRNIAGTGPDPCMLLSHRETNRPSTAVADVYCWEVGVIIALSWCGHANRSAWADWCHYRTDGTGLSDGTALPARDAPQLEQNDASSRLL